MDRNRTSALVTHNNEQEDVQNKQTLDVIEETEKEQPEESRFYSAPIRMRLAATSEPPPFNNNLHNHRTISFFQKTYGNMATLRYHNYGHPVQAKLKVNQPNDKYEQEADRVAEQMMRMAEPGPTIASSNQTVGEQIHQVHHAQQKQLYRQSTDEEEQRKRPEEKNTVQMKSANGVEFVQRQTIVEDEEQRKRPEEENVAQMKPAGGSGVVQRQTMDSDEERKKRPQIDGKSHKRIEEDLLQTKEESSKTPEVTPKIESQIESLRGDGEPLPDDTRAFYKARFGNNFGDVRVHTGSQAAESARAINAKAYTTGKDIVFGAGEYAPETTEGKRLLAHELTHVMQQGEIQVARNPVSNIMQRTNLIDTVQRDHDPNAKPVRQIASTDKPKFIGGISSVDVTLGAYNDRFRITVQTTAKTLRPTSPQKAILGISAMSRSGNPVAGRGAELQVVSTPSIRVLKSSGTSLTLDIDGSEKNRLQIFDTVSQVTAANDFFYGGEPVEKSRNHHIRVTSPAFGVKIFRFKVRWGGPIEGYTSTRAVDKKAASNALAISGLTEQVKIGVTFEKEIDAYEGAFIAIRKKAADENLITQKTFEAWKGLSTAMIKLRPQVNANRIDPTKKIDTRLQHTAAEQARALFSTLSEETSNEFELLPSYGVSTATTWYNPYTRESQTVTIFKTFTFAGPFAKLPEMVLKGQWEEAYKHYRKLVDGLDKWIVHRLKETEGEKAEEAQQAEFLSKRRSALGEIEKYKPIRVAAVFHPDKKFKSEGDYVSEIPLALYAYRDDDTWHLKDLTNPDKPYDYTVSTTKDNEKPPPSLFGELNDPDHFPVGVIHFEMPGLYGGQIKTTDYLTWKQFLTYLGLGLAVVGITLVTAGAGTKFAVVGAWALAGSALASGTASAIDLIERAQHGNLDTATAVLDIAEIIAALAGVSALRSGMIVQKALTAAEKGAPLVGMAAKMAVFFQKVYVVSTRTKIAADIVTVAAFSVKTARELDAIENGPGSRSDRDRAKSLLLAQLAVTGGLMSLSIKGDLPKVGGGRKLILHFPDKNGPPVANVGGMEPPTGLKFSQKSVSYLTGDKTMTVEELSESMRKSGWKGAPIDIVELPNGTKVSLDNRRLLAAQNAGMENIPVAYHHPNEAFSAARAAANEFKLRYNVRQLADGTLVVGGTSGQIVYRKGFRPTTYKEAALVRTVNQGNVRPGEKFPIWGRFEQPEIRGP